MSIGNDDFWNDVSNEMSIHSKKNPYDNIMLYKLQRRLSVDTNVQQQPNMYINLHYNKS